MHKLPSRDNFASWLYFVNGLYNMHSGLFSLCNTYDLFYLQPRFPTSCWGLRCLPY